MASLLSLPPEICSIICDYVDVSLAPLCRISPSFREQAQRTMYRTVDLEDCNMRLVKSWCLAVTRHSRLAERVRSLFLQLPVALEPEDAAKLSRALALCVNLKHLSVFQVPGLPSDVSVQTWMIEDCAFRLERFSNSYFALDTGIETFLDNQAGMRVLSLPSPRDSEYLSFDERLNNLVAIDAPLYMVLDIPEGRPLERIQIHYDRSEYVDGLSELCRFAPTLKTLTVVREGMDWGSSTAAIIHQVAHALPDLQHLGINEKERLLTFFALEETPSHVLKLFTCLETLTLCLRRGICFAGTARTYGVTNTADLGDFGMDMFTGCASLRKVAIGSELFKDKAFYCTLFKREDGNIESNEDEPDFDDEFWI
ncbi:hypothetical protein FB45DRAFT_1018901 [Roridomyces roridus]|uniref:F-box domain-containing protein n=1 Tax=Roridomyces roridus TaxID=1738132 RepID=A0AAD7CE54_9AGAR|nr:hypothetical protein FB45DRAFT_1018901 [Roridomyces roridus]